MGLSLGSISDTPYAIRVDEVNSTTTYVGKAQPGSDESSSSWQILKITISGTVTSTTWAHGDASFNNVWADRAELEYS